MAASSFIDAHNRAHSSTNTGSASVLSVRGRARETGTLSLILAGRRLMTRTRSDRNTASSMLCVTQMNRLLPPGLLLLVPDVQDFLLQDLPRLGVDGRQGLVHQQYLRIVGEQPRERASLLHAAGQLVRVFPLESREMHQLDEFPRDIAPLVLVDAPYLQTELHVLHHRLPREQGVVLKEQAALRVRPVHVPPLDRHHALVDRVETRDDPEQGRLAASAGSHDRNELSGVNLGVDAVERHDHLVALRLGEGLLDAVYLYVLHCRLVGTSVHPPAAASFPVREVSRSSVHIATATGCLPGS